MPAIEPAAERVINAIQQRAVEIQALPEPERSIQQAVFTALLGRFERILQARLDLDQD